jgi:endonuclease/exonuclease/phosphatase (EEP) superfamily protein YafD
MNHRSKDIAAQFLPAKESDRAEAASLAARVANLPSRLEPRAGKASLPDSHTHGRPTRLGRFVYWLACLVTFSLIVIGLLRIFDHDGNNFLTCVNAFTRYVYLPAYVCLAWAIWRRCRFLAVANIAAIALHLSLVAPDFIPDRRYALAASSATSTATDSPSVRIFFANVRGLNTEHNAMIDEIRAADPDVIVLVEFTWQWHKACSHSPLFAKYPYGGGFENTRLGTVNVFSRIPLKSNRLDWFGGRGLQTVQVPVGNQTLHLIGLHAPRPMNMREDDDYKDFWNRTIPMILREPGPLVVVGDFNATQFSKVYERLTADRLRSAHQDRGRGYAVTWPNGQNGIPSLIRIDQALLSPEVECAEIREGEGRGSDHKPLILDVKIRPGG